MLTGNQQQVDSLNSSSQRDPSIQFDKDVMARQIISLAQLGFVSILNTCHRFQPHYSSICLLSPGHQIDLFARSLHFVIHGCPSWIFPTIVFCMATGLTRRLPLSSNPFWIVKSAATCTYSFSSDTSFALSGHPCMQNVLTC